MSVFLENGHLTDYPLNHARILYNNVCDAVTADGEATNFPASALLLDTTFERWKPTASGQSVTLTFPEQTINAVGLAAHSNLTFTLEVRSAGAFYPITAFLPGDDTESLIADFADSDYRLITYTPDNEAVLFLLKPRRADAIRITATYSGTAPTLGVVYAGRVLEMQRPFYQGHNPAILSAREQLRPNVSDSGEWLGASRIRQSREIGFAWENLQAPWVRANWVPFAQTMTTQPFFAAWNAKRFPTDVFYCSAGEQPPVTNSGPRNLQSVTMNARAYSDGTNPAVENLTVKTFSDLFTFTRASTGTYYDAGGLLRTAAVDEARFDYDPATGESLGLLIEESRTNLLEYSENFDNAVWSKTNVAVVPGTIVSPNGKLTADALIQNTASGEHKVNQAVTTTAADYSFSFYAKLRDVSAPFAYVRESLNGAVENTFYDLQNGILGSVGANRTATIVEVSSGWYRLTLTVAAISQTSDLTFGMAVTDGAINFTGDGESGIYFWGAQLEAGSFPTSYTPSTDSFASRSSTATYYDSSGVLQTAAIDVARDDAYGYLDGVLYPIGLLLEDAATNLLTYSEEFDNADWITGRTATVTADTEVAPDGTTTADTIEDTDAGVAEDIAQLGVAVTGSAVYTFSLYIKKTSVATVYPSIRLINGGGTAKEINVKLNTNTGATSQVNADSVKASEEGDYWRLQITYTTSSGNTSLDSVIYPATSTDANFGIAVNRDNTLTGSIVAWGAQLEENSFATSYIPTAGSTVTRSADVSSSAQTTRAADDCVRTLGDEYNSSAGTLKVTATVPTGETVATLGAVSIVSDTNSEKAYSTDYTSDPLATELEILPSVSVGTVSLIELYPRSGQ